MDSPLSGTNGQLMVMAAHRYCLGRRSYIVQSCIEWLTLHWETFDESTHFTIVRDTIDALMDNSAGSDWDYAEWKFFAESKFAALPPHKQEQVFQVLTYKNKPWPLSQ